MREQFWTQPDNSRAQATLIQVGMLATKAAYAYHPRSFLQASYSIPESDCTEVLRAIEVYLEDID